jgi:hypothetical protein
MQAAKRRRTKPADLSVADEAESAAVNIDNDASMGNAEESAAVETDSDTHSRALVVKRQYVLQMLDMVDVATKARGKCEEIRNFVPSLQAGQTYYIAESDHGWIGYSKYVRLALKVTHESIHVYTDKNGVLDSKTFMEHFNRHRVDIGTVSAMLDKWKRKKVTGILMANMEAYHPGNHFLKRPNAQSIWVSYTPSDILAPETPRLPASFFGGFSRLPQYEDPSEKPEIDALWRSVEEAGQDIEEAHRVASLSAPATSTSPLPASSMSAPDAPTRLAPPAPTLRERFAGLSPDPHEAGSAVASAMASYATAVAARTDPCGAPHPDVPAGLSRRLPSECRSMDDCFAMGVYICQMLVAQNDDDLDVLHRVAYDIENDDYSTSFSGYDTIGIGKDILRCSISKIIGRPVRRPRHRWGIEWESHARSELKLHPSRPECCK